MRKEGRAEYVSGDGGSGSGSGMGGGGGGGDVVWVYWRTPEEWATLIEEWVDETAQKGTVLTLYELTEGEGTRGTGMFSSLFIFRVRRCKHTHSGTRTTQCDWTLRSGGRMWVDKLHMLIITKTNEKQNSTASTPIYYKKRSMFWSRGARPRYSARKIPRVSNSFETTFRDNMVTDEVPITYPQLPIIYTLALLVPGLFSTLQTVTNMKRSASDRSRTTTEGRTHNTPQHRE